MNDLYLIAEVKDCFSSDGSVIIKSFSDFPERFMDLKEVFIDFFSKKKSLQIEFAKEVVGSIIIKFKKFNSCEDVQFLINKKLYVDVKNLYKLPQDSYYVHDLIGSEVHMDSMFFGKLIDVLKLPNNDVYVIRKINGAEVLIPAIERFVISFDKSEQKMVLDSECKEFDDDEN